MISVIICTYNRAGYIYHVLECLAANDCPKDDYEIVLVDNNCTDNTADEVGRFKADYPDIRFKYCVETSQGLSYARNRGIREAEGDVIVFLDDDAFPGTDYLSTISDALGRHEEIDCFGGMITPLFDNCPAPDWLCKWSLSWVSGLDMGDSLVRFSKGFPIGANMGFRKQVFDICGDFNVSLGRSSKNLMGGEEKDMFQRIRGKGFGIFYLPGIEVKHVIPESRTTLEYVSKLGKGVGASERLRTKAEGTLSYLKRVLSEAVKWGGTVAIWLIYSISGRRSCGNALVRFRWNVTKTLLNSQ